MFAKAANYFHDFVHLFFPHNCLGCGTDVLEADNLLCAKCFSQLPETSFFMQPGNRVEKNFYGRLPVAHAGSAFYFTKNSLIQQLMFSLKYQSNTDAGILLGKLTGLQLKEAAWHQDVDIIVPMPLNPKKEKLRGYNQATLIADGIAEIIHKPVVTNAVSRNIFTETQTHKNRESRWQNMDNVFVVSRPEPIQGKHILLVDDVVTTGASLEACGKEILHQPNSMLSIATVAYTI